MRRERWSVGLQPAYGGLVVRDRLGLRIDELLLLEDGAAQLTDLREVAQPLGQRPAHLVVRQVEVLEALHAPDALRERAIDLVGLQVEQLLLILLL